MLQRAEMPRTAPRVLTPHEGEMAALEAAFGLSAKGPAPETRTGCFAQASGAVVLLKGPDSLIATPEGDVTLAPRASPWLSVAGSGDVLAGLIASRLAVHGDAHRAAREGLWLHGEACAACWPDLHRRRACRRDHACPKGSALMNENLIIRVAAKGEGANRRRPLCRARRPPATYSKPMAH